VKIENLYQVSGGMEERQEIQMDQPRLKIFRFKHMKTSLEEDYASTSKHGSNEKFVTIQQSDGKSSLERPRAGSKKAASRYDKKTDESDSFERMSNIENEINNIFNDYNNTQNFNEASPKIEESTRELYHRESHIAKSNEKARDDVEDILSNSQISRAHKFNIKRFSAVEEKIVKSKSPPKSLSVMKSK
jgi:cellobiose phosphorylase